MSILNVWVKPDLGLLTVDTDSVNPATGAHGLASKLLTLPHAGAVLAFRGVQEFGVQLCGTLLFLRRGFDETAAALPEALETTHRLFVEIYEPYRAALRISRADMNAQTVALVGWSRRAGRVEGHVYDQDHEGRGFVRDHLTQAQPYHLAPWVEDLAPLAPACAELSGMVALANRQVALLRQRSRSFAAGGRLIAAAVERAGISMRTVHSFAPAGEPLGVWAEVPCEELRKAPVAPVTGAS